MRVLLLGQSGMLGHVVDRYLREQGHKVLLIEARYRRNENKEFVAALQDSEPEWCVNCAGILPRRGACKEDMDLVNAGLPRELVEVLPAACGLIHASSDGVFANDAGECPVDRQPNADDPYGRSKIAGEQALIRPNDFAIRCSIVGPETSGRSQGLMSWFLSSNEPANGYTNHLWNGITTLEWARWCGRIISGETKVGRFVQPAIQPAVSKLELLRMIANTWRHDRSISPNQCSGEVNRVMLSNVEVPSLAGQLAQLKGWY